MSTTWRRIAARRARRGRASSRSRPRRTTARSTGPTAGTRPRTTKAITGGSPSGCATLRLDIAIAAAIIAVDVLDGADGRIRLYLLQWSGPGRRVGADPADRPQQGPLPETPGRAFRFFCRRKPWANGRTTRR